MLFRIKQRELLHDNAPGFGIVEPCSKGVLIKDKDVCRLFSNARLTKADSVMVSLSVLYTPLKCTLIDVVYKM